MFLQLKITIVASKPPIWRRIVVSDELTLKQFHNVLQCAFNWTNTHLYEFNISGYSVDTDGGLGPDEQVEELHVDQVKLKEFPLEEKETFTYTYDYGDNWKHTIVVEKILEKGPKNPSCLDGKRNAPPEDCGGIWGYEDLTNRLKVKKLNKDEKQWFDGYDPELFDKVAINEDLSDPDVINEEGFF